MAGFWTVRHPSAEGHLYGGVWEWTVEPPEGERCPMVVIVPTPPNLTHLGVNWTVLHLRQPAEEVLATHLVSTDKWWKAYDIASAWAKDRDIPLVETAEP